MRLFAGNHREGYIVRVVSHSEVFATVDLDPIHGGKGTGHVLRRQNLELSADQGHKLIEQPDVQSSAQVGGAGDFEHVELASVGAREVGIERARGSLSVSAA